MAHLADAKSMLDSRGLYEGATVHGVNPLLLVEKIIRYFATPDTCRTDILTRILESVSLNRYTGRSRLLG